MREKKMLFTRTLVFFLVLSLMVIDTNGIGKVVAARADELAEKSESTGQNSVEVGTKENPYIITEKAQLLTIKDDLEGYYELGADIVFTDEDFMEGGDFYNSGKGWEPIGSYEEPFEGVLDGKGHQIKNMKFEYPDDEKTYYYDCFYGLFGVSKGNIKNFDFVNVNVTICRDAYFTFGVIAGENEGQILNCNIAGDIKAKATAEQGFQLGAFSGYGGGMIAFCNNYANVYSEFTQDDASYARVGGIAGIATRDVWRCNNYGDVTIVNAEYKGEDFSSYAAGISGRGGMILYCSNKGNIACGGVAAGIGGMPNNIADCYNEGDVTGAMASGICAVMDINDYVIENNYSTGTISGEVYCAPIAAKESEGGLVVEEADFANNYYLDMSIAEIKSNFEIGNGKALTENQMKEQSNFVGFDFENVWEMGENSPVFREVIQDEGLLNIEKYDMDLYPLSYGNAYVSSYAPFKLEYYIGEEPDLTGAGFVFRNLSGKIFLFVVGEADCDYWINRLFQNYDITPKKHGGFVATYRKEIWEVKFIDPFLVDVEYFDTSEEGRVNDIEMTISGRRPIPLLKYKYGTGTFSIDVKKHEITGISIKDAEITLDESVFSYDGSAKEPSVTVKLGEQILELNTDYQIEYQDNIEGGQAKVIVQGMGIYQDSVTKTFTILAPTTTPTVVPTTTPTVAPTTTPTVAPTATPTVVPTSTPTVVPTVTPTVMPEESDEPANTPKSSELPVAQTTAPSPENDIQQENVVAIESFSARDNGREQVVLKWSTTKSGESVSIYRSDKKSGVYKRLVTTGKEKYVDKKVNAGETYYYKIRVDGQPEDKYSDVCKVKVYLQTPKAKIVKKVAPTGQKYMQITVKRWSGNRIILYVKENRGKFKKVKLKSNRISKKKHAYNLLYTGKRQVYYFQIKTYKTIKKKKVYSRKKQYKVSK